MPLQFKQVTTFKLFETFCKLPQTLSTFPTQIGKRTGKQSNMRKCFAKFDKGRRGEKIIKQHQGIGNNLTKSIRSVCKQIAE